MSDSLNGHAPRPVERVYCDQCGHIWPCPGYLAAPAVLLGAAHEERGLDALWTLSDAASEGPWHVGVEAAQRDGIWSDTATGYDREEGAQTYLVAWCHGDYKADEDAAFIVAAVNYVRGLLATPAPSTEEPTDG